ncbi:MAG: Minf_1886 family protein [Isosphaeraceae bacterium]
MSLREHLAGVLAQDPRYTIDAYTFIFEALEYTKRLRNRARTSARKQGRASSVLGTKHVTGQELCEGARRLALDRYGMMALTVLNLWGLHSTSDFGEIVYHLIASGDLLKTASDSRSDFDDVYDFEEVFRRGFVLALDDGT